MRVLTLLLGLLLLPVTVATGHAADISKIETFRDACGETAMALASGITPENSEGSLWVKVAWGVTVGLVGTTFSFPGRPSL